jgi:rubrerythrin
MPMKKHIMRAHIGKKSINPKRMKQNYDPNIEKINVDNNFSCLQCFEKFSMSEMLKIHTDDAHMGIKSVKCPLCAFNPSGSNANSSKILEHLVRTHSGNPHRYKCKLCGHKTWLLKTMKSHLKNVHHAKNTLRVIPSNHAKVSIKPILGQNIEIIRNTKNHICSTCGNAYWAEELLKMHHNFKHLKLTPVCTFCPFQSNFHNILRHMVITHLNIMQYRCKICHAIDKVFETFDLPKMNNHIQSVHFQQNSKETDISHIVGTLTK